MKISYLSTLFLLLGTVAAFGCEKDDTGDGTYVRQNDDDDAVRPPGTAPVTDGTGATGGTGAGGTGTGGTGAGGTGAGGTGAGGTGAGGTGAGGSGAGGSGAGGTGAGGTGAGGTGGTEPVSQMLFAVEAGVLAQVSTKISEATNPQSSVYTSTTGTYLPQAGTHDVALVAADLGLAETDAIDAISVLRPIPDAGELFYFVVAEKDDPQLPEGLYGTAVRLSAGEIAGDVYFSDGVGSHDVVGESGEDHGYNALYLDEQSLGLDPVTVKGINALEFDAMPTDKIYFSVSAASVGLPGSAVEATTLGERGCTIYASDRDGTNTVAYTCGNLDVPFNSDVDALAVLGDVAPTKIIYSIKEPVAVTEWVPSGVGAPDAIAGDVFSSDGAGGPRTELDEVGFGINPGTFDDIVALAVRNVDLSERYKVSANCTLTPTPAEILVDNPNVRITWISPIADGIGAVVVNDGSEFWALAYDFDNGCAHVASSPVIDADRMEIAERALVVPKAGWSRANPFLNVQLWAYWRYTNQLQVWRVDLTTGDLFEYLAEDPTAGGMTRENTLVHLADTKQFSLIRGDETSRHAFVFDVPVGGSNSVPNAFPALEYNAVPWPCDQGGTVLAGYDADEGVLQIISDLYWKQQSRVCTLTPDMFLMDAVRPFVPDTGSGDVAGYVVPGEGVYRLDLNTEVPGDVEVRH